ncbi:MAG TPA: glutamate--tRNA ligase, partial [Deltaproteobacteria bacterium]|nr:glutamate--tRNA ligase [Deltaproteobacteria bacterium]
VEKLRTVDPWEHAGLEEAVRGVLEETGLKFKILAQPMRVALTGKTVSPGIFEIMATLGRDRVLDRLSRAHACMRGS